ncbi:MAG: alanine--glyoxylate aminotransferase family protein [Planctomycetes bacterium]|nr:alanine--glyoxylate aminotransferase family protein [Planctomycetota bacterium]
MATNLLWIPGPTHVRPEILAECARPMIGHRSKAMTTLTERLDPGLKLAFGLAPSSTAHVAVHTTSATGMMESALKGVGPKVLCLVNGSFSKRWYEIAGLVGKEAHKVEVPMGQSFDLAVVEQALAEKGPFDALTLVSNETSSGVRTPLAGIAKVLTKHPNTMFLVDLVSYIAGAPVDFDANKLDFGFAGVQKAFALPPGISVVGASQRYLDTAKQQKLRGFYLDPIKIIEGHEQRATPATPCISLYYALAKQLEDISNGVTLPKRDQGKTGASAWQARFDKHVRMQQQTEAWAESNDLRMLPAPEFCSPTISCVQAGGLDVTKLIDGLKAKGHQIGDGYGDLKGKTFRIGHMGDHTEESLAELLAFADDVVKTLR